MKSTHYTSTHARLCGEGYSPEQDLASRSVVSVNENGKKYRLSVANREMSVVYAVDGDIVTTGQRCDKLVLVKRTPEQNVSEEWTEIFVELKGRDTRQAIEQLRATLNRPLFQHPSNAHVRARIVAQSFPSNKSDSTMEKAKKEFLKDFNCDLRGLKSGQEDKLP